MKPRAGFALAPALLLALVFALSAQALVPAALAWPQALGWRLAGSALQALLEAELAHAALAARDGACPALRERLLGEHAEFSIRVTCVRVTDEEAGVPVVSHHLGATGEVTHGGLTLRRTLWR
jgi:hypothetical protein